MPDDMELALAPGWTQVAPRRTEYQLLLAGQIVGQKLILTDTAFEKRRVIGPSGGINCPLALSPEGDRVFLSYNGITSYSLTGGETQRFELEHGLSAYWMLNHHPDRRELLMHASRREPASTLIARLDLETGTLRTEPWPKGAFSPKDMTPDASKVLYASQGGAAVYSLDKPLRTLATVDLPFQVLSGAFDLDDTRVILGGRGLVGWNTVTGETAPLCKSGLYPVIHKDGSVWFALTDGALARLLGDEGGHETVVELTGVDTSNQTDGSYAQPIRFSTDGRYGYVTLTGRTRLTGQDLEDAEAFARSHGREPWDFDRHAHNHYFCVLDVEAQEVWCHEGYADNTAWVSGH